MILVINVAEFKMLKDTMLSQVLAYVLNMKQSALAAEITDSQFYR